MGEKTIRHQLGAQNQNLRCLPRAEDELSTPQPCSHFSMCRVRDPLPEPTHFSLSTRSESQTGRRGAQRLLHRIACCPQARQQHLSHSCGQFCSAGLLLAIPAGRWCMRDVCACVRVFVHALKCPPLSRWRPCAHVPVRLPLEFFESV